MRRIIERTVTIVTTTIWKISWQEDLPTSKPEPKPDPDTLISRAMLQDPAPHSSQGEIKINEKEAGVLETKEDGEPSGGFPLNNSYAYLSKKGNEKP